MRIANLGGRAALVRDDLALDIHTASAGALPADPADVWGRWTHLCRWAEGREVASSTAWSAYDPADLGAPSPRPAQIFAIGLNYSDHADETGMDAPDEPMVFTKFPTSVAGPYVRVALPGATVDWEAELVVVIGVGGRNIRPADARLHIAGYTVGQDLSDRTVQLQGPSPQFSLGKSFAGFAPTGPFVVTLDEFRDPDALTVRTTLVDRGGRVSIVQDGTTANLLFPVAELVARLSRVVELLPGDLVFTGTPAGVGMGMTPPRYLRSGDVLHTDIEGIGRITQIF